MKKCVLLGIVAVALLALPAFAGDKKIENWDKIIVKSWVPVLLKELPVKMKIPWYIKMVNEKDWVLWLEQKCGELQGQPFPGDLNTYCFYGCKDVEIQCNFDAILICQVTGQLFGGKWACWWVDGDSNDNTEITKPGETVKVCVKVSEADLLDPDLVCKAGTEMQVATLKILVQPAAAP